MGLNAIFLIVGLIFGFLSCLLLWYMVEWRNAKIESEE